MTIQHRDRRSALAVNLGMAGNILLAALKTTFGIVAGSPALLADGINSTSDVAYYIVVAIFMRLARKPADPEHPYGHRQLESIAAVVVGSFVITTAVAIFWNAVSTVYDLWSGRSDFSGATLPALWVALFTIVLKFFLTFVTRRLGTQTNNAAVMALAYDHRNDVISATGAAIGIFLGRSGYPWGDPLAGAMVALIVLRTGIRILSESSDDLMDTVPGHSLAQQISDVVSAISGVQEIEEVQAHRFGPFLVINVTIGVNGALTVAAGDEIASQVEQALYREVDLVRRAYVHYHPVSAANKHGMQPGEVG